MSNQPDTDKEKIEQLLEPKHGLGEILGTTKVVEDVLANNIKTASQLGKIEIGTPKMPANLGHIGAAMEAGVPTYQSTINYQESPYLPKSLYEHPKEYALRLKLTPICMETPNILQSRMGSMFKKPPTVSLPEGLKDFESNCTMRGETLNDVIAKMFDRSQVNGFAGILIDRRPLPKDVAGRENQISKAEQTERKLGAPVLALYTAWQILDWDRDDEGLVWVKLIEQKLEKTSWDKKPDLVKLVRIVDRKEITVYEIRKKHDEDQPTLKRLSCTEHGQLNKDKKAICPFYMANPLPAEDGIGRSVMRGTAEADVTATRILSDLIWLLHMTAPLITLHTARNEDEVGAIGVGATRINYLKNGTPEEREELAFVQIDTAPIDKLSIEYDKFVAKAREQSDRMNLGSITGPGEVSGVSKAWSFKTSEERILYLFGHCLQDLFQKVLEQIAVMEKADPEEVTIKFPETYDIQGPTDVMAAAERFLTLCQTFNLRVPAGLTLERLCASYLQNPEQTTWDEIVAEIESEVVNADSIKPEDQIQPGEGPNGQKKTNGGKARKKSEIRQSGLGGKADDEGEDPEDRRESDAADYQGNRK